MFLVYYFTLLCVGGILHDETCYGNNIYLLNLKNFTWSSIISSTHNGSDVRGRYSHVAAAFNESTLLVAGGFSGISNGDFLAYKIPYHDDPSSSHMCHMFSQCVTCLTWGSGENDFQCGWCVQDSTCYQRDSPSGPCSTTQTTRGWWGNEGSFLTAVDKCRFQDNPPGLLSTISYKNHGQYTHLINPLREILSPKTDSGRVTWSGFIYPLLSQSIEEPISLKLRIGKMSASLHLSTDELKQHTVISSTFNRFAFLLVHTVKILSETSVWPPNNVIENVFTYVFFCFL